MSQGGAKITTIASEASGKFLLCHTHFWLRARTYLRLALGKNDKNGRGWFQRAPLVSRIEVKRGFSYSRSRLGKKNKLVVDISLLALSLDLLAPNLRREKRSRTFHC